jgi:hypothetical protein
MNEGSDSVPQFMAPRDYVKMQVEFQANLVSCFDSALTRTLGEQSFIDASGYISSASLKTSHPCRLPLRGKEYRLSNIDV